MINRPDYFDVNIRTPCGRHCRVVYDFNDPRSVMQPIYHDRCPIGNLGFWSDGNRQWLELQYHLRPAWRRKGIIPALLEQLIVELIGWTEQLRARVVIGNTPAEIVLRRLGFEATGFESRGFRHFAYRLPTLPQELLNDVSSTELLEDRYRRFRDEWRNRVKRARNRLPEDHGRAGAGARSGHS